MPYNPKKNGAANYKSWMQLTDSQISAIEAIEGADNTASPNDERFASMVHVVNAIPLEVQDIQIGAVELKNATTDDRVNVEIDDTKNAVYVQSESLASESTLATLATEATVSTLASESTLATLATEATVSTLASESTLATLATEATVSSINSAIQTPDAVAGTKIVQLGGVATTSVPVAVSNADAVKAWYNEYGQPIIYGSNLSSNALDINQVNQALLNTISVTLLNAVTADGSSSSIDMSNYNKFTVQYIASSVSTGATLALEGSLDGTNFYAIKSAAINTNGTTYVVVSDEKHKYVRSTVSSRTDGTYSVYLFGGN